MTPKPEPSAPCPTPAWGAKVAQQATAQSEAVAWLIERKDGYVEITRHKEAADGWASVAKITPLGPLATPPAFPARDEVLEKRASVKLELAIEQVLFSRVMKNRVAGYTVETAHEIMELVIAALSSQGATREGEVVFLREVDAGTDSACWVISNRVDPDAVPFFSGTGYSHFSTGTREG